MLARTDKKYDGWCNRCPMRPLYEDNCGWHSRVLRLYSFYDKGHLPEPGSIMDQPNVLLECFETIDGIKYELDKEDLDKAAEANNSSE